MKGFGLYIFPVFFLNVCSSALLSQTPDAPVEKRTFEYFNFVSIPQFKGGDSAAIRFFSEHIRCPRKVLFFHAKDTVIVSFIARKGGFIADVTVLRGQNSRQKQTVLNAVNAMPLFTAAESAGYHPRVLYCVAIAFDRRKRAPRCTNIFFFKAGAKSMYYDKEWMSWVRIR